MKNATLILIALAVAMIATAFYIYGEANIADGYHRIYEDGSVLLDNDRVLDAETGEIRDRITP